MNQFMAYDFDISKIVVAIHLGPRIGDRVHNARASHGLAFLLEGEKNYTFDGNNTIRLKKNSIIYLPKHSNYIVDDLESGACYAINFDVSDPIDFPPFALSIKNSSSCIEHFRRASALWAAKPTGAHMKCKAELYNILYLMQREYELGYSPTKHADILRPAIEYIHNHYTGENINIGNLAQLCSISEPYFRKLFSKSYGVSPLQYINTLKIARAKELISSQAYTISEVSQLAGFHDDAYFSREFKKVVGVSPSAFK